MKCPHCSKEIHFEEVGSWVYRDEFEEGVGYSGYAVVHGFCPACAELIVLFQEGLYHLDESAEYLYPVSSTKILYPLGATRPISADVPAAYATDYREAAQCVGISPKASAALSRRILQAILRDECHVKKGSLSAEIEEFINAKSVPSYLSRAMDSVRAIGNLAAHPLKDKETGVVVEVEDGEAEWLLDVLDSLFDYIFVQPKMLEVREREINEKLERVGKPPLKVPLGKENEEGETTGD